PAVRESCLAMQSAGCQLTTLDVDGQGRLRTETLPQAIGSDTILACLLLAHNETGVIQDIRQLASHCREQQVPLLLDAVPAVGRIPVSFRETGAAALAFGAHKFHGPRGIGGLLLREDIQIPSMLRGGHQERGRRAGTEPVPLIAGMAEAMRLAISEMEHRTAHLKALRDRLQEGLQAASAPVVIHGQLAQRLPNTLSIGFPGVPGDALLVNLHMEGVSCSLGSACASGSAEPAPALLAMGIAPDLCRSSVRFSLNYQNTAEEIERVIPIVARIVSQLREAQSF
ncbi:MAG: cysteine desulfurase family protein, partial [Planctomycetaceae bacterium]